MLQNCTDEGKHEALSGWLHWSRAIPRQAFSDFCSASAGEREAIQKSVNRSCLLLEESSGEEELPDSGGEEAAEAMA